MTVPTLPVLTTETVHDVVIATLDGPGSVNTLGPAAIAALVALLDDVERDDAVRAVVLQSAKPDSWIAGFDIEELARFESAADGERTSREAHALLDRVERCRVPWVAAIQGACLGGGLELALACAWRIAADHPSTALALPEVQLGLVPGGGGTQRLPRCVGLGAALDLMLTGRRVRARQALGMGLVDDVVHPAALAEAALRRARELADGRAPTRRTPRRAAAARLLDGNALGRALVLRQARERVLRRTHGHYPAPLAVLDAVREGYARGVDAGLRAEARHFGELAVSAVSRELVYLFFATTALKKDPGSAAAPRAVAKLGVVGAGFMGAGIAAAAAAVGTPVRLRDTDAGRVGKGLAAARADLVTGTTDYTGFRRADLVIEAVFEDLDVKRRVIDEIERAAPDAIVASNTSTIPIARLAERAARPERVIGMHFFSPVAKMPLLEVIEADGTAPETTATAVAFGKRLGKTVIVVRDGPGFYVNRILNPYVGGAGRLLDEGVAIDAIDRALVDFGFPVGPITLLDEVGLDIAGKSGRIMHDAFGARMAPAQSLLRVLDAGRLGRKGRLGFYRYDAAGKKRGVDESVYALLPTGERRTRMAPEEIVRRTVGPLLEEAERCLAEGIIRSARDGDVGAVFGIGFPAWRGGPFRYLAATGTALAPRHL
ncbi:Enoyl-CoA hydratase/isomerase [Gemmatirosa kalamazoonensis]|uniref:enoyl-CoA hydratase n=1 Tax=Gemmatirosa kalamazoonensis TaxID=861299 RepID=W0RLW8_9BACT|nr:3-hydroxyacyl-CoA dehydrogenase NAD-binding domain-containing protein [Gemmatirosa kalamazoonensis]AHG92079.1 Enoyl-CoA hydratase/isomerase [Gemmatirosa kalamazoonensis]